MNYSFMHNQQAALLAFAQTDCLILMVMLLLVLLSASLIRVIHVRAAMDGTAWRITTFDYSCSKTASTVSSSNFENKYHKMVQLMTNRDNSLLVLKKHILTWCSVYWQCKASSPQLLCVMETYRIIWALKNVANNETKVTA